MSSNCGERTAVALDPYPLWLGALGQLALESGISVLGTSTDRARALELVEHMRPAIFISGSDGHEKDAFSYLAEARTLARHSELKIVVLAHIEDEAGISEAFAAGADMYIFKSAPPQEIAAGLRQIFEPSFFTPGPTPLPLDSDDSLFLTRRERQVLRLVAAGQRNAAVAQMLWVTEQTIKFHLSNIYRKLGVTNRTEASRWAQMHGLHAETLEAAGASSQLAV